MADISDLLNFEGLLEDVEVPEELMPFVEKLLYRLDMFRLDLINQLNKKDDNDTFNFTAIDSETADPLDISVSGGTTTKGT